MRLLPLLPFVFALAIATAARAQEPPLSAVIAGGVTTYTVRSGDTVGTIAARFGVAEAALLEANQLARSKALVPGQLLVIDNRHLAMFDPAVTITINLAQRRLVHADGDRVTSYPIAVGRRTWPTPIGAFTVIDKEKDPAWDVPESIQREMEQQGKPVITRMPPSPQNPLGARWIRLSFPNVGIHGTNAPGSIYKFTTHGCMRMHPDDVADLFERVTVGTIGRIIYRPVLFALIGDRVWIEVNPDEYRRAPDAEQYLRAAAAATGLTRLIEWNAVKQAIRLRRGGAVDVTAPKMTGARDQAAERTAMRRSTSCFSGCSIASRINSTPGATNDQ